MTGDGTPHLFAPVTLGRYELAHRVVMAPLTRLRAGPEGVPGARMAEYYGQRASPGGLIIGEAAPVSPRASGGSGAPGLFTAAQAKGWAAVVDAVHARGGRIFAQLWHAGRLSHPALQPDGDAPVAPSALRAEGSCHGPQGLLPFAMPRALGLDEIGPIVAQYRDAAVLARQAGFDGVEIHAANGYLPGQFLHSASNLRRDNYGGARPRRARFLFRILAAVMAVYGVRQVGVRLSPGGTYGGMADEDMAGLYAYLLASLAGHDLAYVHLIVPRAGDGAVADLQLPALRRLYRGTIIAADGFDRFRAEAAIRAGDADLIAFGRHFLANPDLPARLRNGWPLNAYDRATFYGGDARGYTDYPVYSEGGRV